MRRIIITLAVAVAAMAAKGQTEPGDFTLTPKVGMAIAKLANVDAKFKTGFIAGVEAEYRVSEMLGVSAGAFYSMQGAKYENGAFVDLHYNDTYEFRHFRYDLNYINIPILANIYVVEGLALKVGVQPAFLVSSKEKATWRHNDEPASDDVYDADDMFKKFDLSIPVGLSYQINDFVIDARYNIALLNINSDEYESTKNSVIQVTIGYEIDL